MLVLAVFILWILYIPAANIINAARRNLPEWPTWKRTLAKAYLYTFLLVDYLENIVVFSILFLEFPSTKVGLLVTDRLKHHLRYSDPWSWRYRLALWICTYLVEPWDSNHCGLKKKPPVSQGN